MSGAITTPTGGTSMHRLPYRQGDVALIPVDVIPEAARPVARDRGRLVLRYYLRVHPAFGEQESEVRVPLITLSNDGRELRRRTVTVPRTPHAAIAWTFGLTADEYRPAVMS